VNQFFLHIVVLSFELMFSYDFFFLTNERIAHLWSLADESKHIYRVREIWAIHSIKIERMGNPESLDLRFVYSIGSLKVRRI